MKRASVLAIATVVTTGNFATPLTAQSNNSLDEIAAKYKACIKIELDANVGKQFIDDFQRLLLGKAERDADEC